MRAAMMGSLADRDVLLEENRSLKETVRDLDARLERMTDEAVRSVVERRPSPDRASSAPRRGGDDLTGAMEALKDQLLEAHAARQAVASALADATRADPVVSDGHVGLLLNGSRRRNNNNNNRGVSRNGAVSADVGDLLDAVARLKDSLLSALADKHDLEQVCGSPDSPLCLVFVALCTHPT